MIDLVGISMPNPFLFLLSHAHRSTNNRYPSENAE